MADPVDMNNRLLHEDNAGKQAEQKDLLTNKDVAAQLSFLQSVIDSVPDPIMVIRPDFRVKLMNRAARNSSGDDTFCYRISHHADSPCSGEENPCPLRDILITKAPTTVIHTHTSRLGNTNIVEISASPIFDSLGNVSYIIEICRDITDKIRQEEVRGKKDRLMFQQQKEESIATLAGGISHDFNNILMGVLGYAELLGMHLPLRPEEQRYVDGIIAGVERMATLTRQLLAYAKGGKYQIKNVSMYSAIRTALELSHKGTALATKIILDLPADLWSIMADENQITQMFFNVFENAFEATSDSGGTLTIKCDNVPAKPSWVCRLHHEHPGGDYIHIAISDTGHGISQSIEDTIFDPFVTTKFMGRGLGLSAVLGIVQNHGGCVTFLSKTGKGTTFHILLPRSEEAIPASSIMTRTQEPSAQRYILIVDDEPNILQFLEKGLGRLGYAVVTADTGEKALQSFRTMAGLIDVAILDLQLPGMSGKSVLKDLKAMKPDLKIIISTGYDRETAIKEISPYLPEGFIQKPYMLSVLKEMLREILTPTP